MAHLRKGRFGFILGVFGLYLGLLGDLFGFWDNLARFLYGVAQCDKMAQWIFGGTRGELGHPFLYTPYSTPLPFLSFLSTVSLHSLLLCFFSSWVRAKVRKARICNDLQKPQTGESCREFWAFRLPKSVVFRVVNATLSGASEGVSGGSESHSRKNGGLLVRP